MLNVVLRPIIERLPENNRLERIWKLAQVDFRKRYYNDKLGLLWAFLNPLLQISVYWFMFKYLFGHNQENYGLFLFSGFLVWRFFIEGANKGLSLIRQKKYLIENIQFNKIDLFISQTVSVGMGFTFNFIAYLIITLLTMQRLWNWDIILSIPLILNIAFIGMGMAMILATISIHLKDITHAWAIVSLFGFWTSGVFMRGDTFLDFFPPLEFLHPFIGIIANMRAITMFDGVWQWDVFWTGQIWGITLIALGTWAFNKYSFKALETL